MRRTLTNLCLFFGFLLGGCVTIPIHSKATDERATLEEECFNKVVNYRTWGQEVPPEDLLAYIGGNWKVKQVRVFQKITKEKSPSAYFAYAIEPTTPGKDMNLSNVKATLLCESSPEYMPLNSTTTFITSFNAREGAFNEIAMVQSSLDQFSIFSKTAWLTEKKGNFLKTMDEENESGLRVTVFKMSSKEADVREYVKSDLSGVNVEIFRSITYELRDIP